LSFDVIEAPLNKSVPNFAFKEIILSHPLNFTEGSKSYQSLLSKCFHGVFRPFGDAAGKSSACGICNSHKVCVPSNKPLKAIRKIKQIVPCLEEVFGEQDADDSKELYAETNVAETD
jgi:hypothetical protein